MLTCVYHRNGEMRVVSGEEATALLSQEGWFPNPWDAKKSVSSGIKTEQQLKDEIKSVENSIEKLEDEQNGIRKRGRPKRGRVHQESSGEAIENGGRRASPAPF